MAGENVGLNPNVGTIQTPEKQKRSGLGKVVGSAVTSAVIGTAAGGGFGYFKPLDEDTFVKQSLKNDVVEMYKERIKNLETKKTNLAKEIEGLADGADRTSKQAQLTKIETRLVDLKKQGSNNYAKKVMYDAEGNLKKGLTSTAEDVKAIFADGGKTAVNKETFEAITKSAKMANAMKFAKMGAIYATVAGVALSIVGALSGKKDK